MSWLSVQVAKLTLKAGAASNAKKQILYVSLAMAPGAEGTPGP